MMMGLLGVGLSGGGGGGLSFATLDGTASNAALSGGNLTATHSNGSTGGARSASTKSTGKYYFEVTLTTIDGLNSFVGLIVDNGTYGATPLSSTMVRQVVGQIDVNSGVSGYTLGTLNNGDIIGMAVDFGNSNMWFRKAPSGLWNGDASANPATNVNGVNLNWVASTGHPAGPMLNFMGTSAEVFTANFGATTFSGTVPSGFTSGWPA